MKLKANRGRRDAEDVARLLAVCKVTTVEQAQQIYESYQPQEVLPGEVTARIETVACQVDGTTVLPRPRDRSGRLVMVISAPVWVN
jgi:hypothetical protein